MTWNETMIADMVETLNIPFAYHHFPDDQQIAPPFIVYTINRDDVFADNANYQYKANVMIEFCTRDKDFETETAIESMLASNDLSYTKAEGYIEDEKMYQIGYSFQILMGD